MCFCGEKKEEQARQGQAKQGQWQGKGKGKGKGREGQGRAMAGQGKGRARAGQGNGRAIAGQGRAQQGRAGSFCNLVHMVLACCHLSQTRHLLSNLRPSLEQNGTVTPTGACTIMNGRVGHSCRGKCPHGLHTYEQPNARDRATYVTCQHPQHSTAQHSAAQRITAHRHELYCIKDGGE